MGALLDEMCCGYLDGFNKDSPEPGANRSDAYCHGFFNGRDDLRGQPRDLAQRLREQADAILAHEGEE